MGMSEFYGASDDAESLATLHAALDLGVAHFDSADAYGHGHNEQLLGRFLAELPASRRLQLTVATKFGIVREPGAYERRIDNSPAYIRQACEDSLKRLGLECIDLYYCHRRNPEVPLAEVVGAMAELVRVGKVRHIGFSEISEASLRQAHAMHPVAALQSEYSLWTRGPEADLLPATQALGIAFVAYSPLGRAFLTSEWQGTQALDAKDFRRALPRFNGAAESHNHKLQAGLRERAEALRIAPSELALAWMLHKYPHVLPIPGTRRRRHLASNMSAAGVLLDGSEVPALDALFAPDAVQGARYPDAGWVGIEQA